MSLAAKLCSDELQPNHHAGVELVRRKNVRREGLLHPVALSFTHLASQISDRGPLFLLDLTKVYYSIKFAS